MKKYLIHFVLFIFAILALASCTARADKEKLFATEQEAIQFGIDKEGIEVVTQESYEGETILLIANGRAVSVASISKKKDGFSWHRAAPFFVIVTVAELDYVTESGKTLPLLIGKSDAKRVRLQGNGVDFELEVQKGYFMADAPYNNGLKVTLIE